MSFQNFSTDQSARAFLNDLFQVALTAVDPLHVVPGHLPEPPRGRTVVVGAGKAAARMAEAVEAHWEGALTGLVVTRYGHGAHCRRVEVVEAGHPVPDAAGHEAAERILALVSDLTADDLVICLISGGGSSLLSLPAPGISLADKQAINKALLRSGASISEMNCVRSQLSAIKGGLLAEACAPARVVTLVISDVPGDDPAVVASGPTIPSRGTAADALAILQRYGITPPAAVQRRLEALPHRVAVAQHPDNHHVVIATAQQALDAAAEFARAAGVMPLILGNSLEGESREVARVHAAIARQIQEHGQPLAAPALILSGGETTVTVRGHGRGGRNAEFLAALAQALAGRAGIYALAADTDGIDGSEDNAGAVVLPDTLARGEAAHFPVSRALDNNDAYAFFAGLGDLLVTGPTRTNVNDFRAILVV